MHVVQLSRCRHSRSPAARLRRRSRHGRAGRHLRPRPGAERGADRKRRRILPRGRRIVADAEHAVMRAHHAFGAARQHAGNFLDQLRRRLSEMHRQQRHQRLREITAGEIVDAAIALGLADDGDDIRRADRAADDQSLQRGKIAGMRHRQSENLRAFHAVLAAFADQFEHAGSGLTGFPEARCRAP